MNEQEFVFSNGQCGISRFLPGPFGMIIPVITWAVMVELIFKIISIFLPASRRKTESKPMEILNQCYAATELSKIEFAEIKQNNSVQP